MFSLLGDVKGLIKLDKLCIDNNVFRLHYKVGVKQESLLKIKIKCYSGNLHHPVDGLHSRHGKAIHGSVAAKFCSQSWYWYLTAVENPICETHSFFWTQATQLTALLEMLCLRTWWTPTAGSTPLLRNLSKKTFFGRDDTSCELKWSGWRAKLLPRLGKTSPTQELPLSMETQKISSDSHLPSAVFFSSCICWIYLFACWENQVILSIILFFGFSLLPQKIRLSFSFFAILILEFNFPSSLILLLHFDEQAPQVLPVGLLHPLLPGHPLLYTQVPHLYLICINMKVIAF